MFKLFFVVFLALLRNGHCVPPTTNDDVVAEVTSIKNTIKVLSDQWEKWNTLFVTSLEPRITSTASTLSSIDSNIHNLQERAHIWDTFQLHVAAWNDQLASLDRKMDILSKGMEKLMVIDGKLSTVMTAEYKLDRLTKIVNSLDDSLADIGTSVKSRYNTGKDSLFEEFAARGILSSLKLIERKLDRLLIAKQNEFIKIQAIEGSGIKCSIPKATEELLNDISSKVDIIFDVIHKKNYGDYTDDYIDVKLTEGSGEIDAPSNLEQNTSSNKRPFYLSSRRASPGVSMSEISSKLSDIERNLIVLQKHTSNINYDVQNVCNKTSLGEILRNLLESHWMQQGQHINVILDSYFREHRTHIESILDKFDKKTNFGRVTPYRPYFTSTERNREERASAVPSSPTTQRNVDQRDSKPTRVNNENEVMYITNNNKSSCDHLSDENNSGVYIFKNSLGDFMNERFFNKKLCLVRDDGLWTIIQRRDNYTAQQSFNLSWSDYKMGFGDLRKDFWIGNTFLSYWSRSHNLILRIELEDFDGNSAWAEYGTFHVGDEDQMFKLTVGDYSGNASDAFSSHNGALFSTYDRKNDNAPECCPCSPSYGGGWWFTGCFESNLNGIYYQRPNENEYFRGIIWEHWLGNYSLKKSAMMIKTQGYFQVTGKNVTIIEEP